MLKSLSITAKWSPLLPDWVISDGLDNKASTILYVSDTKIRKNKEKKQLKEEKKYGNL